MRTVTALALVVLLAGCGAAGNATPAPSPSVTYDDLLIYAETPTSDELDRMTELRDECINGKDTACSSLWWQAVVNDPSGSFLRIAATCGGRREEHRPESLDDVSWVPCPVN